MKIRGRAIAVVAAMILVAIIAAAFYLSVGSPHFTSVNFGGRSFAITNLEVNMAQWQQGLMNKTVTNGTIALFVFPKPAVYPFWMYDTYYNLDIIWVNATAGSGTVVYIARNATSCFSPSSCQVYTPNAFANYVIEAQAGFASRNNIGVGTRVVLG
ncbi:MAG: DUF192 domain-containing protein [Candidatus Micrarchaeota archaeon]|nr:DUF192 domain-containing protein [Candidatus Micrarchaeota archaeon]MDE1804396.1 DUF192 domain-containing protein [Candidatus Micrarchaeota archaeon]